MIEFFSGIADFLVSIVALVVSFIGNLTYLFEYVGKALTYVSTLSLYLPPAVPAIAMIFITVSVVYLILGR